jgi:hypothetical protein
VVADETDEEDREFGSHARDMAFRDNEEPSHDEVPNNNKLAEDEETATSEEAPLTIKNEAVAETAMEEQVNEEASQSEEQMQSAVEPSEETINIPRSTRSLACQAQRTTTNPTSRSMSTSMSLSLHTRSSPQRHPSTPLASSSLTTSIRVIRDIFPGANRAKSTWIC